MGLRFIWSLRLRVRSPRDLPVLGSGGAELAVVSERVGSGEPGRSGSLTVTTPALASYNSPVLIRRCFNKGYFKVPDAATLAVWGRLCCFQFPEFPSAAEGWMDPLDTMVFAPAEAQLPWRWDAGVLGAGVSPGGSLRVAGTVPAGPALLEEEEEEEGFGVLGCPYSREQGPRDLPALGSGAAELAVASERVGSGEPGRSGSLTVTTPALASYNSPVLIRRCFNKGYFKFPEFPSAAEGWMDPLDTMVFAPAEAQLPWRWDAGVLGAGVSPGGSLRVAGTGPAGPALLEEEEEEEGFGVLGCPYSREQLCDPVRRLDTTKRSLWSAEEEDEGTPICSAERGDLSCSRPSRRLRVRLAYPYACVLKAFGETAASRGGARAVGQTALSESGKHAASNALELRRKHRLTRTQSAFSPVVFSPLFTGETVSLVDVDISQRGLTSPHPPTPPPPPRRSLSLLDDISGTLPTSVLVGPMGSSLQSFPLPPPPPPHAPDAFPRIVPLRPMEAMPGQPTPHLQCPLYRPDSSSFAASLRELEKCGWYWGPMNWEDAEMKLKGKPDGSFLVRDSSDPRYILSLSFRSQGITHHTRMEHYRGTFSLWCHPKFEDRCQSVVEFIKRAIMHSKNGKFLYFLRSRVPGLPPTPVQLLYPVSRFSNVKSLQHLCRFRIRQLVRIDHIPELPLPKPLISYIRKFYYYDPQEEVYLSLKEAQLISKQKQETESST
ncbi:PREDICTED: suppressor of cytokine signaling 7 [Charadrius vociferus]|nr:PREDICTED: suppressor of cytokine signaling 7 [Charadrius vociferus]